MTGYFNRVSALTPTRLWVNNVTLKQARLGIEAGAIGSTQNPSYLSKVLPSEDREWILEKTNELLQKGLDDTNVVAELQRYAISKICNIFHPVYEQTGGRQGFVSIQADPYHENKETILYNASKSLSLADNFIIKIPVTADGLSAISQLTKEKVPILATEVMSMDQVKDVVCLYEDATQGMRNPAPLIIAHINGIFDEYLQEEAARQGISVQSDSISQAALMLGRKVAGWLKNHGNPYISYLAGGARGLNHFTHWVGASGAVTINWKGTADKLIEQNPLVVDVFSAQSSSAMLDELLEKLPDYRSAWQPGSLQQEDYETFGPVVKFRKQFEAGWSDALTFVKAQREQSINH